MLKALVFVTRAGEKPPAAIDRELAKCGLTRSDVKDSLFVLLAVYEDAKRTVDTTGEEQPPSLPPGSIVNKVA